MTNYPKKSIDVGAIVVLLFLLAALIPYEQRFSFKAEAGELACIEYEGGRENTITINCNSSFLDVAQTMEDSDILENLGNGEYILNANLEVADDVTFSMTSAGDGLQYLKLAGDNGIIVYGQILIDDVKITSWDIS